MAGDRSTADVSVSFFGVRGSTPCSCPSLTRIGGNTSCVVISCDGEHPIICDLGTGLRFYGLSLAAPSFTGSVLVSHLHWDHVQGLPFFPQLLHPDSSVQIYGPPEDGQSFEEAFSGFLRPPYFPVDLNALAGSVGFTDFENATTTIGTATVTAGRVPHTGSTNGYRIEWGGVTIAYVPDHQQPADGTIAESVLELARDADLLIHDSQFTPELLEKRPDWGHCTTEYAHLVATEAGAKRLAMFHHDPLHDDDKIDLLEAQARDLGGDVEVLAAAEGMKLTF